MVSREEQQHKTREAALFPARRYCQTESESEQPDVRLRPYRHHGNPPQRAEVYVVPLCRNLASPSRKVQKWHRPVLSITEGDIWPIYWPISTNNTRGRHDDLAPGSRPYGDVVP